MRRLGVGLAIITGLIATGCGSGSDSGNTSQVAITPTVAPTSQPATQPTPRTPTRTATSGPATATKHLRPSPALEPLAGFGATVSTWKSENGGLNTGAYSAVQAAAGFISSYDQDFPAVDQKDALSTVTQLFPPDTHMVQTRSSYSCYRALYQSHDLAKLDPASTGKISVYVYTGYSNGRYNPDRVNNAIVDGISDLSVAC